MLVQFELVMGSSLPVFPTGGRSLIIMVQELQEETEQQEAAYKGLQSKFQVGVDQQSTLTVSNSLSPHSPTGNCYQSMNNPA